MLPRVNVERIDAARSTTTLACVALMSSILILFGSATADGQAILTDPTNSSNYPSEQFPVRGSVIPENAWTDMTWKITSSLFHTKTQLIEVVDRMDFRARVTMSSRRPFVSVTCNYNLQYNPPYLGKENHYTGYMIVDGEEVLPQDTSSIACNGENKDFYFTDNDVNYASRSLEVAMRGWTQNADDDYMTAGAKTGRAFCDPLTSADQGYGTICRF